VGYYIGTYYCPEPGNICVIPNARFSEQQQLYEINCDSMRTYTLARSVCQTCDGIVVIIIIIIMIISFYLPHQKQFTTRVKIILYIIQTHRNHPVPITRWIKRLNRRLESLRLVLQKTLILLYRVITG